MISVGDDFFFLKLKVKTTSSIVLILFGSHLILEELKLPIDAQPADNKGASVNVHLSVDTQCKAPFSD